MRCEVVGFAYDGFVQRTVVSYQGTRVLLYVMPDLLEESTAWIT